MKIGKLLGALKNMGQIYEGVKNNVFKTDYIEEIASHRWQACQKCPNMDPEGKSCAAPGTQPCCSACGCSLAFKTRSLSASCPLTGDAKKWDAVMDRDDEKELHEQLREGKGTAALKETVVEDPDKEK
jgi:hypothetical protein